MDDQDKNQQNNQSESGGNKRRRRRRRRRPANQQQGNQQQGSQQQDQQKASGDNTSDQGEGSSSRRPSRRRGRRSNKGSGQGQQQPQQNKEQGQQKSQGQKNQGRGKGGNKQEQSGNDNRQQQGQRGKNQQRRSGRRPVRRPRRDEEAPERRSVSHRQHGSWSVLGPIDNQTVRMIPLGGVGEIGKNMTAFECGPDLFLIDAGGKFPEEDQRGIDLIIPDITFIKDRIKNFRGILLTHGHEDHIGALPYVVPQLREMKGKVPIYGTPLALGFVERKLMEARLEKEVELHPVEGGETVQIGNLKAEYIHVTHSIPDACAIAIHTPIGTIVDTGDFKFDPTPVMGGPSDERRLKRLGDKGVLALFSDTTRVEVDGTTPSEKVVLDKIEEEINRSKGQVIIATFASNISRIHMALKAAEKHGRKVAVAGRSMEQNSRVAVDLGYLDPPDGLLIPLEEALRLPKEKRVIVCTGSQGEVSAALARIAAGEHPKIRVSKNDTVIVSATPIPGNEDTVSHTINNLFRLGADVVYSALDRGVHVSGHAAREELARMVKLLRPTYAVPIHGEYRHMSLYREVAAANGVRKDHAMIPEIGGVIEFTKKGASQKARVKSGNILVDRLGDRDGRQTVLRTREDLTDDGFVVVTVVLDRQSGELIAGPNLIGKGLGKELNGALKEAERELKRMLDRRKQGSPQYGYVVQRAKESVAKVLYRRTRSRPLILPIVTEL